MSHCQSRLRVSTDRDDVFAEEKLMDAPRFLDHVTTDIIHYESKKVISSASIHRGELNGSS